MTITQIVKNATAEFMFYRQGHLYYKTSTGFEFTVPVDDTNDATFAKVDKAIFFMRWIRKQVETTTTGGDE